MKNEKVYLWSDLPWDIALAQGMKTDSVFNGLDAIKDKDSDEWWLEAERLEARANTALGEKLWLDIYNGKLPVRKSNGDPLDGEPKAFQLRGVNAPHLTREEGNKWLSENRYLQSWNPTAPHPATEAEKPWLLADPKDPDPEQPWYTPARYFARDLVKGDSTLLLKTLILADKTSKSLAKVGIYKRGGKKPFVADTILKAFSNVKLG
jgi:hypothetical protein